MLLELATQLGTLFAIQNVRTNVLLTLCELVASSLDVVVATTDGRVRSQVHTLQSPVEEDAVLLEPTEQLRYLCHIAHLGRGLREVFLNLLDSVVVGGEQFLVVE